MAGGTGQAIALADRWGIPVVNLARGKAVLERLSSFAAFRSKAYFEISSSADKTANAVPPDVSAPSVSPIMVF